MIMQFQLTLLERIKEAQGRDPKLQEFREQVEGRWSTPSVTRFVCRRERFDMKYYQKPIIRHILYIQEGRRCINIWSSDSGDKMKKEILGMWQSAWYASKWRLNIREQLDYCNLYRFQNRSGSISLCTSSLPYLVARRKQYSIGNSGSFHEVSTLYSFQTGTVYKVVSREVHSGGGETPWHAS